MLMLIFTAFIQNLMIINFRWNKDVGYCQGFNMLAAIILEVMDKSESDSLKVNDFQIKFYVLSILYNIIINSSNI